MENLVDKVSRNVMGVVTDIFFCFVTHIRVKQIIAKKNVGQDFVLSVVDWLDADLNSRFQSIVRKRRV